MKHNVRVAIPLCLSKEKGHSFSLAEGSNNDSHLRLIGRRWNFTQYRTILIGRIDGNVGLALAYTQNFTLKQFWLRYLPFKRLKQFFLGGSGEECWKTYFQEQNICRYHLLVYNALPFRSPQAVEEHTAFLGISLCTKEIFLQTTHCTLYTGI